MSLEFLAVIAFCVKTADTIYVKMYSSPGSTLMQELCSDTRFILPNGFISMIEWNFEA